MTTFNFLNKKTGEYTTFEGTIAEAEAHDKKHPELEWLCGLPLIHSGLGLKKPDSGFRDVLTNIKKQNPHYGHAVNDFGGGSDV